MLFKRRTKARVGDVIVALLGELLERESQIVIADDEGEFSDDDRVAVAASLRDFAYLALYFQLEEQLRKKWPRLSSEEYSKSFVRAVAIAGRQRSITPEIMAARVERVGTAMLEYIAVLAEVPQADMSKRDVAFHLCRHFAARHTPGFADAPLAHSLRHMALFDLAAQVWRASEAGLHAVCRGIEFVP